MRGLRSIAAAYLLLGSGCVGTTGGDLIELDAYAAGPTDAEPNFHFENSLGYQVTLTEARLFVGGVYLNRSRPSSVSSDTSCSLAGVYVAEVLGGRELDLLSPLPQVFPQPGFATTERAQTGEVWLSAGDVNRSASSTVVLRVAGDVTLDGAQRAFTGTLSIGQNRVVPATDPALPGQHPICKQRIVSPIVVDLRPSAGRALLLRVDPRGMFANVDFSTLSEKNGALSFSDQTGVDQASDNLYAGLRRASGVYDFGWMEKPE